MTNLREGQLGYLLGMFVGDGSLIRDKPRGEFLVKIAFRQEEGFGHYSIRYANV